MRIFVVRHRRTVQFCELRKLDRYRRVDRQPVTRGVADVVGQRPNCKGNFIRIRGFAKQTDEKTPGANIMREITKEVIAKGVIAETLKATPAVCEGMGTLQLSFGGAGK